VTGEEDISDPECFLSDHDTPWDELKSLGFDVLHLHSMCHDEDLLRIVRDAYEERNKPGHANAESGLWKIVNTIHLNYEYLTKALIDKILNEGFLRIADTLKLFEKHAVLQSQLDQIGNWIQCNVTAECRESLSNFLAQLQLLEQSDMVLHLTRHGQEKAEQYMGRFLAGKHAFVLGNGVHPPKVPFVPKPKPEVPTLVYSGRLSTEKGIVELCEAFNSLDKRFAMNLIIHGDPPLPPDFNRDQHDSLYVGPRTGYDANFFKQSLPDSVWHQHIYPLLKQHPDNKVKFYRFFGGDECNDGEGTGRREETYMLDHVMEQADAVIIPSYSETFCIAALDAMIRRRPVIISKIPSLEELYQGACIFIEPQNHASLEAGIRKFLDMPQSEVTALVEKAHNLVQKRFMWEQIAHETLFKYLALLPFEDGRWHPCDTWDGTSEEEAFSPAAEPTIGDAGESSPQNETMERKLPVQPGRYETTGK